MVKERLLLLLLLLKFYTSTLNYYFILSHVFKRLLLKECLQLPFSPRHVNLLGQRLFMSQLARRLLLEQGSVFTYLCTVV